MNIRLVALIAGMLLVVGACSGGTSDPQKPDYTPVPDDELFSQVSELPGVERSDISFNNNFPDTVYVGRVTLAVDADAQKTLDTIYAILRQGRPNVDMNIQAQQGTKAVTLDAIDGPTGSIELEERYGPQPGDGTPPKD